MFLLTCFFHWRYAVPITVKTVIWFSRQEQKRIAALCGIFMSVYMASLSFFGRVVWGASCSLVLVSSRLTHSTPPTRLHRADFQTEKEDLSHDNT